MVARRRSKSPSGRSGARDAGVLIVTQPPATVFQTQVSGNGTQDSSTMLCLTVQLGPDEHASVRGLKSAGIKAAGLVVAELYRFDHTRVPVYCPEKQTMVGLRVPQAVFEFDVETSAPTMLLRCRRKHLPVSKNYGGAPFRFVLHFATTGTTVSTDPFVIASKQPQPKQNPKRKRKRSEMLPYPEQDTERDVAIQRALQGACDERDGPARGGCGTKASTASASSSSSGSGPSGVHASHGEIVLSRLGAGGDAGPRPRVAVRASTATPNVHVPMVGGGVSQGVGGGLFPAAMAPLVVGSGAAHPGSAEPPRPRKRRRVSVNPDAQVMGHSGCDECTATATTRAVSSGVSVPRDALVTGPADAFARILVGESKRRPSPSPSMPTKMKMKMDMGMDMAGTAGLFGGGGMPNGMGMGMGMGPGLGLALGPCSSRRMSMCSTDGAPGVGGVSGRCDDDGQGSTASGGQSSQGTAEEAALVTLTSYRSPGRGRTTRDSVPMEDGCDECDEGVIGVGDDPWSDEGSDVASVGSPRMGDGALPFSSSSGCDECPPRAYVSSSPLMSLPCGGGGVAASASSSTFFGGVTPMRGVSIPGRGVYPQGSPILLAGRMAPEDSCVSVATDGGL